MATPFVRAARGTLASNIFAGDTSLGPTGSAAFQGLGGGSAEGAGGDNSPWYDPTSWGTPLNDDPGTPLTPGTSEDDVILQQIEACTASGGSYSAFSGKCEPKKKPAASTGGGGGVAPKPSTPVIPPADASLLSSITADPMMLGGIAVILGVVGLVVYKKHKRAQRGY